MSKARRLMVALGLPAEVALAASVLNRLALLVTVLLGGVLLARGRPRLAERKAAAEPERVAG